MSKYNLIDIYEQYQIGSGWTRDFDYDGMLNTGLGTSIDTPIEVLKKIFEDFTDVNYHREAEHLHYAIEAIEIGDMMEAQGKISDFHAEIRKTQEDQGMDMSDDLGAFMASKMEEGKDKMNEVEASIDPQKLKDMGYSKGFYMIRNLDKGLVNEPFFGEWAVGFIKGFKDRMEAMHDYEANSVKEDKDKDKEPRDGVKSAAAKLGMKPKHVKEVSSREGSRIESLLNQQLKAKFLNYFEELFYDLVEEDPFHMEDVIDHLSIEMSKRINGNQMAGDRLAGLDQQEFTAIDEEDKKKKSLSKPVAKDLKKMKTNFSDLKKRLKLEADAVNFDMKADTDYDEGLEDIEEALPKFEGVPEKPSIIRALKVDGNGTKMEIDSYMASLKRSGDEFDEVDDYVEDFKNYVADKSLQEHFGRFMKDYQ